MRRHRACWANGPPTACGLPFGPRAGRAHRLFDQSWQPVENKDSGTRIESPSPRLSAIQALLAAMRVPAPSGLSPSARVQRTALECRNRGPEHAQEGNPAPIKSYRLTAEQARRDAKATRSLDPGFLRACGVRARLQWAHTLYTVTRPLTRQL